MGYHGLPTEHTCSVLGVTPIGMNVTMKLSNPRTRPTCRDVDECASKPCLNDATCVESSSDSTVRINTFKCKCTTNYAGTLCEDLLLHPCISKPCTHGGTCIEAGTLENPTWNCTCATSYSGAACNKCRNDPKWTEILFGDDCKKFSKNATNSVHSTCLEGLSIPKPDHGSRPCVCWAVNHDGHARLSLIWLFIPMCGGASDCTHFGSEIRSCECWRNLCKCCVSNGVRNPLRRRLR